MWIFIIWFPCLRWLDVLLIGVVEFTIFMSYVARIVLVVWCCFTLCQIDDIVASGLSLLWLVYLDFSKVVISSRRNAFPSFTLLISHPNIELELYYHVFFGNCNSLFLVVHLFIHLYLVNYTTTLILNSNLFVVIAVRDSWLWC